MILATNRRGGDRALWRTVLGLLVVPLTIAGLLVWGLWNPGERLHTVTAAIVNLDEPVELDGQLLPLGRVLAAELVGDPRSHGSGEHATPETETATVRAEDKAVGAEEESQLADSTFTWVLSDAADAAAGLADGRYATVVTIPENFSRAATAFPRNALGVSAEHTPAGTSAGLSAGEGISDSPAELESATVSAVPAVVQIDTSERGRLLDAAIADIVTAAATEVLNAELGAQYVGGVFVGMHELRSGLAEAANGAQLLADGSGQLHTGMAEFARGSAQLASGAEELAAGSAQLVTGTAQLADGAQRLSGGARQVASGAEDLTVGAAGIAAGANGIATGTASLAQGARESANGQLALADGIGQYVGGVNTTIDEVLPLRDNLLPQIDMLIEQIEQDVILFPTPEAKAEALAALQAMRGGLSDMGTQLTALRDDGTPLAAGAAQGAAGAVQLADGLDGVALGAGQLAAGASSYSAGVTQFSAGVAGLSNGVGEFAAGVHELARRTPELASGSRQLADGASAASGGAERLALGVSELAGGSSELANGLHTAFSNIPEYSAAEREQLARLAVQPVTASGGSEEFFHAAGVPLFTGVALWAGGFAIVLALSTLWSRTQHAARSVAHITVRSVLPIAGFGAAQGALVGLLLPPILGYDLSQTLGFFWLALLGGTVFALVNQGLKALLGGAGTFLSFSLLVVTFAIGVISTAPPLLQAIGDASPIAALLSGLQATVFGGGGLGAASVALLLWGVGGVMLTAFAISRRRRRGSGT